MPEKKHFIYRLLVNSFVRWFIYRNHVEFRNDTGTAVPEDGPLLIVSNHVGTFDPVEISIVTKRQIHWVSGAYLFKMKFVGWFFTKVVQGVPKQQGKSDLGTILNIQKRLAQGCVVGIFPEGTRTWDGELMNMNYKALAKMVKILKCPVLFVTLEGGFAREPRWVCSRRRGPVTVVARYLATGDYIAKTELDALSEEIKSYLYFSNDEWKEKVQYCYVSSSRAEGLQRLFYMCPVCKKVGTIKTNGCNIICSSCSSSGILNDKDDIESDSFIFKHMAEWHNWEKDAVADIKSFEEEPGCLLQRGPCDDSAVFETLSKRIVVSMRNDSIYIGYSGNEIVISFEDIRSFILNAKQTMEFITDSSIYRVRLDKDSSSLKYLERYNAWKKDKC